MQNLSAHELECAQQREYPEGDREGILGRHLQPSWQGCLDLGHPGVTEKQRGHQKESVHGLRGSFGPGDRVV